LIPISVAVTHNFKKWLDREAKKQKKSRFDVIEDLIDEKQS
jgi:hypothetical protein